MTNFFRHKAGLFAALALLAAVTGCSKQDEPTPNAQLPKGVSAELAAVLAKHHATYEFGTSTTSRATFRTPQELDSLFTAFEKGLVGARLEIISPTKLKGSSKSNGAITNRIITDGGTVAFDLVLPNSARPSNSASDGTVFATLNYTYCSGDGNYRSASLGSTSFQGTDPSTVYQVIAGSQVVNVYSDQIRFSYDAYFTYSVSGAGGGTSRFTQKVALSYVLGLNEGQTIVDGDFSSCGPGLPAYQGQSSSSPNSGAAPYGTQPNPDPIKPPVYSPSNPNPGNNTGTNPGGGGTGGGGTGSGGTGGDGNPPTHYPGPPAGEEPN